MRTFNTMLTLVVAASFGSAAAQAGKMPARCSAFMPRNHAPEVTDSVEQEKVCAQFVFNQTKGAFADAVLDANTVTYWFGDGLVYVRCFDENNYVKIAFFGTHPISKQVCEQRMGSVSRFLNQPKTGS